MMELVMCKDRRGGDYIPRLAITNDLDADLVAHGSAEGALDEVLVHPSVQVAHPVACQLAAMKKIDDDVFLPESAGSLVGNRLGDAGGGERVHAAVAVRGHVLIVATVLVETAVVLRKTGHVCC